MKMIDNLQWFISPGGIDLNSLTSNLESITIEYANGKVLGVDPQQAKVTITEEHPQVERMEEDWGAICEVFRQTSYYFLTIAGIGLTVGDQVTIQSRSWPGMVRMKVIDTENGRARIDPPKIKANGGPQNP